MCGCRYERSSAGTRSGPEQGIIRDRTSSAARGPGRSRNQPDQTSSAARSPTERMNSPQRTHEVRLRGLSVTGECHAAGGHRPGKESSGIKPLLAARSLARAVETAATTARSPPARTLRHGRVPRRRRTSGGEGIVRDQPSSGGTIPARAVETAATTARSPPARTLRHGRSATPPADIGRVRTRPEATLFWRHDPPAGRLKPRLQRHEVRLRGLSVTGEVPRRRRTSAGYGLARKQPSSGGTIPRPGG